MTTAIARFNEVVSDVIATHDGVRPVEQGEGDSFVAAFARASDAVACALELQRAPLAPIRLRIGVHTGEIQLRDEGNYAEGAALSAVEAIAYTQRGRGERKRPASGWTSLTPTERDVVRLVSEGLGNNDIATRLFVSPRAVQSHLTHVYTKLGLTSRVQLVQEAARHA
jgi:DNA-binding CsgD family transcriptional regulator